MNSEGYNEARKLLAIAVRERAPATAEAFAEISPLSYAENACVFALATLLGIIDWGNGPEPLGGREVVKAQQIPTEERMKLQRAEFDAAEELANAIRAHGMTPVVDDDYPEVRHRYEGALRTFLKACEANGRPIK